MPEQTRFLFPWVFSAPSRVQLLSRVGRLGRAVAENPDVGAADVAAILLDRSDDGPERLIVRGSSRAELVAETRRAASGRGSGTALLATAPDRRPRVAAVFPGQGADWRAASAGLHGIAGFARHVAACARIADRHGDRPLPDLLAGVHPVGHADVAHPAMFTVQTGLFDLLRTCGVRADAVLGHSMGDAPAACAAGALSLADGLRLTALRGAAVHRIDHGGGMVSVGLGVEELERILPPWHGQVDIAGVNGPRSTVISGTEEALADITRELATRSVRCHRLANIEVAAHGIQVDPLETELLRELRFPVREPTIPLYSTLDARRVSLADLDPGYWYGNLRRLVRFREALESLVADGIELFLEISPHPVLTSAVLETLEAGAAPATALCALRRGPDVVAGFHEVLARLFLAGVEIDWAAVPGRPEEPDPVARSVLAPVFELTAEASVTTVDRPPDSGRRLVVSPGPERAGLIAAAVGEAVRVVLHRRGRSEEPDPDRSFLDQGFDSLAAVELRDELTGLTGLRLASTCAFDHPTPRRLAGFLLAQLSPDDGARGQEPVVAMSRVARDDDPIVIVGAGCKYPGGVASREQLWELVAQGRHGIGPFPEDRDWDIEGMYDPEPGPAGKSYVREGGFLYDAAAFDAGFFGISPREAIHMDPQQRLLLEVAWEALEDSGIEPRSLAGTLTGTYLGVAYTDYLLSLESAGKRVSGFGTTGRLGSVVTGRLAYVLGLRGPAVTIDTACSSSLVGLHLAVEALRAGDCTLALAGGVQIMPTPHAFLEFSLQRGLSPDARCKSYADAADGTAWAEGVGVLVLQRMSDARRQGHRVLAVVAGSAINQDGASNGLTAPNGLAQQQVIRRALAAAGLAEADVDAVEGHGTGTVLGDPIEARALLATYGRGRSPDRPLWLGSFKSNIGHAQAASGVGGVIKMIMALRHESLPATLHVDEPSSHVDWDDGSVRLLTEPVSWPRTGGRPRRAGISSFGISGTNAHVIIEEAPAEPATAAPRPADLTGPIAWVLSARSRRALSGQAGRLLDRVHADPTLDDRDVARSLATSRSVFEHRAVVLGANRDELLAGLGRLAEPATAPLTGVAKPGGKLAFCFSGQGAQWATMGKRLSTAFPVFGEALEQVCAHLDPLLPVPVRDILFAEPSTTGTDPIAQTGNTQPCLFAFEVALAALLREWGVEPDLLIGHSVGEIAAAQVAGILTLPDAARLIAARGRLMQALPAGGRMLAVAAPERLVEAAVAEHGDVLALAAVNSPGSVVVSGDGGVLERLAHGWTAQGYRTKWLRVSHAFHSPAMDPMLASFREELTGLTVGEPRIPLVSNLTGAIGTADQFDADYWVRHVRAGVRFQDGVGAALEYGVTRFVEVGPGRSLAALVQECLPDPPPDRPAAVVIPSLAKPDDEARQVLTSVSRLFTTGVAVDWSAITAPLGGRRIDLPTYAFDRQSYWVHPPPHVGRTLGVEEVRHPWLSAAVPIAGTGELVLTGGFSMTEHPWLAGHRVLGAVVVPGAALLDLAVAAGDRAGCSVVEELVLEAPLVLADRATPTMQVTVGVADGTGRRAVAIHSRAGTGEWVRHASGYLHGHPEPQPSWSWATQWPPPGAEPIDVDGFYAELATRGLSYAGAFRGVRSLWRRDGEIFGEIAANVGPSDDLAASHAIHPALLDGAWQVAAASSRLARADGPDPDRSEPEVLLPFSLSGVSLLAAGASALRVRLIPEGGERFSVAATDPAAVPVLCCELTLRRIAADDLPTVAGSRDGRMADGALFALDWRRSALPVAREAVGPGISVVLPIRPTGPDQAAEAHRLVTDVLARLQDFAGRSGADDSRLVVVTSGAVAVGPDEHVIDPAAAAVWGLVRAAQVELPGRVVLVDLPTVEGTSGELDGLVDVVLASGESQVALREGVLWVPRLVRLEPPAKSVPTPRRTGPVLVTGASGLLGSAVSRHLVREHGVRELIVISRHGRASGNLRELEAQLRELGARVTIWECDVADRARVDELVAALEPDAPPIGVVHAAGLVDDGILAAMTPERVDRVLRPKVDGAWHLHRLTEAWDLDFFVVFSSVAGVIGSPGQTNYAAANAFLDGLMSLRADRGLPGTSLAWGLWAERSGLTAHLRDVDLARLRRGGLGALSTARGLELFDAALAEGRPSVVPMALADVRPSGPVAPLLTELFLDAGLVATPIRTDLSDGRQAQVATGGGIDGETLGPHAGATLRARLAGSTGGARRNLLREVVQTAIASVLGMPDQDAIDLDRAFRDLGFDSLTTVELRNQLSARTGLRLPATIAFDHPNPGSLADFLDAELAAGPSPETGTETGTEPGTGTGTEAPGPDVHQELDRLATVLARLPGDAGLRAAVAGRLAELLAGMADNDASDGPSVEEEIRAAGDEEIFALLDREFGIS